MSIIVSEIKNYLLELQSNLCQTFSAIDGKTSFRKEEWTRDSNWPNAR